MLYFNPKKAHNKHRMYRHSCYACNHHWLSRLEEEKHFHLVGLDSRGKKIRKTVKTIGVRVQ